MSTRKSTQQIGSSDYDCSVPWQVAYRIANPRVSPAFIGPLKAKWLNTKHSLTRHSWPHRMDTRSDLRRLGVASPRSHVLLGPQDLSFTAPFRTSGPSLSDAQAPSPGRSQGLGSWRMYENASFATFGPSQGIRSESRDLLFIKFHLTRQRAPPGRGSDTQGKDAARARPSRAARVMLRTPPRAALGPSLTPSPGPAASGQDSAGSEMLKRTRLERPAPAAQPPPLPPLSGSSRACAAPLARRASLVLPWVVKRRCS